MITPLDLPYSDYAIYSELTDEYEYVQYDLLGAYDGETFRSSMYESVRDKVSYGDKINIEIRNNEFRWKTAHTLLMIETIIEYLKQFRNKYDTSIT